MYNIKEEASVLANALTDIDNLRHHYKKKDSDINVHFVSPYLLGYETYRHHLLLNSERKQLDQKYYQRPDYLSYDEYGTTIYWTVLMYINNVYLIEDFIMETVIVPSFDAVYAFSEFYKEEPEILDLDNLPQPKKIFPKVYEPTYKANIEQETEESELLLPQYKRETFVIKIKDLENKYVLLQFTPKIESIIVRVKETNVGYLVPLFDVHYNIKIDNEEGLVYFVWDKNSCMLGDGMEDILLLDSILEIQYQVDNES